MKNSLFFVVGVLVSCLISTWAWSFSEVENFKVKTPRMELREAAREGLAISRQESAEKREIISWKTRDPGKYAELAASNNDFVSEIQAGLGKVEPAKSLAKLYLMKHVNNNWPKLRQTVFTDTQADSWPEARKYIKDELEKITLVPTASKTYYRFEVPWGFVLVKKDLHEVKTEVKVAAHLDGNKLQEGAADIKIPEEPKHQAQ